MTEGRLRHRGRPRHATIPRELLRDAKISRDARLLWAAIEDYSNGSDDAPWPSQETLAEILGCTDRSVRNWLNELVRTGWLDVEPRPGTSNLHWLNWERQPRNAGSAPPRNAGSAPPRNAGSDEEEPGEEEPGEVTPPAPPQAGGVQPGLWADDSPDRGAATRAEKKRTLDPHHLEASFAPIWKRYSSEGGSKGNRKKALAEFEAALRRGATTGEISTAVENHHVARESYHEIWGRWPGLVHGCRFFRDQVEMFDHPWTLDELRYWPPPNGKDWEHTKKRRSIEELMAAGGSS